MQKERSIYGLLAEFGTAEALLDAASGTYDAGYRKLDAYSPFPIHGLAEAIGFHRNRLPLVVLIGGVIGCVLGYATQYYASVIDYPLNVGGRPLHSWPAFIPVTFEVTILVAAFSAVLGMLALNGLPRPHHPVFNVARFERASRDRFFLCIEATDAKFHPEETRRFLESLEPYEVTEVES